MRLAILAVLVATLARASTAQACACCDAKYRRVPVGWTDAGGAILVDAFDTEACETKRRLEIWPVGATQPSGCFDLFGDPDKRIDCDAISWGRPRQKAKRSSRTSHFSKPPTRLDPSKVRMSRRWDNPDSHQNLTVSVEVERGTTWHRVWRGVIRPTDSGLADLTVSLWPNPRRDRALLLLSYSRTGSGNQAVDVHWVELR